MICKGGATVLEGSTSCIVIFLCTAPGSADYKQRLSPSPPVKSEIAAFVEVGLDDVQC